MIIHPHKDWRTVSGCPHFMWVRLIYHDDTPLWFITILFHYIFSFFQRVHDGESFTLELSNQLGYNLAVSLTIKDYVIEVFLFDLAMTADYSIVNDESRSVRTEVRMGVSGNFLSTSGPTCMTDTDVGSCNIIANLFDEAVDTVKRTTGLFCMLKNSCFNLLAFLGKGNHPSTVISSVFEELDPKRQRIWNVVAFGGKNTNDATTLSPRPLG